MNRLFLLAALALISCKSSNGQHQSAAKNQSAVFKSQKSIHITSSEDYYALKVTNGDDIVFVVTTTNGGNPKNDTQLKSVLYFQIPSEKVEFQLTNTEIFNSKVFLERNCRCIDSGFNEVMEGEIIGKKEDKVWSLKIEVRATGHDSKSPYEFRFDGIATAFK